MPSAHQKGLRMPAHRRLSLHPGLIRPCHNCPWLYQRRYPRRILPPPLSLPRPLLLLRRCPRQFSHVLVHSRLFCRRGIGSCVILDICRRGVRGSLCLFISGFLVRIILRGTIRFSLRVRLRRISGILCGLRTVGFCLCRVCFRLRVRLRRISGILCGLRVCHGLLCGSRCFLCGRQGVFRFHILLLRIIQVLLRGIRGCAFCPLRVCAVIRKCGHHAGCRHRHRKSRGQRANCGFLHQLAHENSPFLLYGKQVFVCPLIYGCFSFYFFKKSQEMAKNRMFFPASGFLPAFYFSAFRDSFFFFLRYTSHAATAAARPISVR